MKRTVYWLNPIFIYTLLMVIVVIAYKSNIYTNYKGITIEYVYLYFFSYILFCLGYGASKLRSISKNKFIVTENYSYFTLNYTEIYDSMKFLATLCLFANFIMLINFVSINSYNISYILSPVASELRKYNSGMIPGVTTFVLIAPVVSALGSYLISKSHKYKKKAMSILYVLFFFALVRTYINSERLALVEIIVPAFVVHVGLNYNIRNKNRYIIFPIIAFALLFIFFGVFEYFRSWIFYAELYPSYTSFIVERLSSYYTFGINNECLYLTYLNKTHFWLGTTLDWLWQIPGFSYVEQIWGYGSEARYVLNIYGDPEFNNSGGLLGLYSDFGYLFVPFQMIFGFIVGKIYRGFKRGNFIATLMFSNIFFWLLELPRYFGFTSRRAFFVYLGIFIVSYSVRNKRLYVKKRTNYQEGVLIHDI